jgi:hypothetical protein
LRYAHKRRPSDLSLLAAVFVDPKVFRVQLPENTGDQHALPAHIK